MILDAAVILWMLVAAGLLICPSRSCAPVCRVFSACKVKVPVRRDRE